jgi:hypothetical protein
MFGIDGLDFRVTRKLGIDFAYGSRNQKWVGFFRHEELRDILDVVTVAYTYFKDTYQNTTQEKWIAGVSEIFSEECVHYRVDGEGGVHFSYDAEFARNEAATVASLQGARYANALTNFNAAMTELGKAPPDCKTAIRNVFASAEGLFKLMFPDCLRLTEKDARKLEPIIQSVYSSDDTAKSAAMKLLNSCQDWINSAHFYRHEQGQEEPTQPPLELTVHIVSSGASFIRWLAELDAKRAKT